MLSVVFYSNAECNYAECNYAECNYAECRYAKSRGAIIRDFVGLLSRFPLLLVLRAIKYFCKVFW